MPDWIEKNKNKDSIIALNQIIEALSKSTNYDDFCEVMINSVLVRSLFKAREKLYNDDIEKAMREREIPIPKEVKQGEANGPQHA